MILRWKLFKKPPKFPKIFFLSTSPLTKTVASNWFTVQFESSKRTSSRKPFLQRNLAAASKCDNVDHQQLTPHHDTQTRKFCSSRRLFFNPPFFFARVVCRLRLRPLLLRRCRRRGAHALLHLLRSNGPRKAPSISHSLSVSLSPYRCLSFAVSPSQMPISSSFCPFGLFIRRLLAFLNLFHSSIRPLVGS